MGKSIHDTDHLALTLSPSLPHAAHHQTRQALPAEDDALLQHESEPADAPYRPITSMLPSWADVETEVRREEAAPIYPDNLIRHIHSTLAT